MELTLEQIGMDPWKSFRFLEWTDNVTDVIRCRMDGSRERLAGAGERWHFHPEYELTLITKGEGKRFVGDDVVNFSAPDLVLIGPNLPHCYSDLRESSGYSVQFVLDADRPLGQLDEMRALESILKASSHGVHFTGPVVGRLALALKELAGLSMLDRLAGFIRVLSELSAVRPEDRSQLCRTEFSLNQHDPHTAAISGAVSHVLSRLTEEISIDELLEVTRMSKATFSRHFKRHTGRSLTTFVNEVRVLNAKHLLAETTDSVTEVAYASGFRNLSHFNTQFRRSAGESPRAFRVRIGKGKE